MRPRVRVQVDRSIGPPPLRPRLAVLGRQHHPVPVSFSLEMGGVSKLGSNFPICKLCSAYHPFTKGRLGALYLEKLRNGSATIQMIWTFWFLISIWNTMKIAPNLYWSFHYISLQFELYSPLRGGAHQSYTFLSTEGCTPKSALSTCSMMVIRCSRVYVITMHD